MTVHVFSTLTASNTYVKYADGGGDLPVATRSVTIRGGSNLPNKHLVTPIGIPTEVSDEDYSWLQDDEVFKLHMKNGFITVRETPAAAEKVAADMETRDQSAPLVAADFNDAPPIPNADGITGSAKPVGADDDDTPTPRKNNRRA